jgi:hypothetical protein
MNGQNGQSTPERWGGRIGLWTERGTGGTEISIRRIRPVGRRNVWSTAEEWIRRWPFVAVGTALFVGLVLGLRSER